MTPLQSLIHDVRAGILPRPSQTVSETVRVREGERNVYHSYKLEAPGYLVLLERLYKDYHSSRLVLESVMRHDPSNSGRGMATRAASSVLATTVSASERVRIRDSHDARPASKRSSERPYSPATFAKDVRRGGRDDGTCQSLKVPAWFLATLDESGVSRETRTAVLARFSRRPFVPSVPEREGRKVTRQASRRDERAARMRQAAGTIRMGEQD